MRCVAIFRFALVALFGVAAAWAFERPARAQEPDQRQLEAIRQALEKYKDPYVAVRDLYLSTVACVYYDGDRMDGHMDYPKGAMGIHFVNLTISGPPDPMRPNVLLYEPVGKELRLVGVEWLVPLAAANRRPTLLGQPFQGPMEGHEPLIPGGFHHYDLHLWLFEDNPNGMFSPTNPNVSCDGTDFALLEDPTRIVPEN